MWPPTMAEENILTVKENAVERWILWVLLDHNNNQTLRQMSGMKDIIVATRERK